MVLVVLVMLVVMMLVFVLLDVFGLVVGRGLRLVSCRRPPNSAQWKSRIQLWSCSDPFINTLYGLYGVWYWYSSIAQISCFGVHCCVVKHVLSPTSISLTKNITRGIVVWLVFRTTQAKWAATHLISVQNYWLMSSLSLSLSFCTKEKAAGPVASGDRWIVRQI